MGDPGEMTEFANDDAVFCALNITSSAPGNNGIASRVVVVFILFLCNFGGANAATQPMLIRYMVRRRRERCILLPIVIDEVYEFPPIPPSSSVFAFCLLHRQ